MNFRSVGFMLSLMAVLALPGCQDLGTGSSYGTGWSIYLLADPSLTSYQIRGVPIGALDLSPTPLITLRDVRFYNWTTHEIEFSAAIDTVLDTMALRGTTQGIPFVVLVGNERIFGGTFWWGFSSMMPYCPYIETISPKPRRIQLPPLHEGPDARADMRIYSSFKSAGLLIGEGTAAH